MAVLENLSRQSLAPDSTLSGQSNRRRWRIHERGSGLIVAWFVMSFHSLQTDSWVDKFQREYLLTGCL